MLDKKKFRILIILGVAILVALIVAIFTSLSSRSTTVPAADSSAQSTASASASPTAPEVLELTQEEKEVLQSAGAMAARFDTKEFLALTPADYEKAGFTETLAKTYQPIWHGLFDGRTDQQGARIQAEPVSLYLPDALKVLDYTGSQAGSYVIRAAVKVRWTPISVFPAPGKELNWSAVTNGTEVGRATWILSYDQLSKRILKVEQPSWQGLNAEPLFEAMGVPVLPKETTGSDK